jgi:hypothetical protein
MRILFDHGTPGPLIQFLEGHIVTKAKNLGWERLVKPELLKAAEEAGFEVLLTTDKHMASQRNLKSGQSRLWCLAIRNGGLCSGTFAGSRPA